MRGGRRKKQQFLENEKKMKMKSSGAVTPGSSEQRLKGRFSPKMKGGGRQKKS